MPDENQPLEPQLPAIKILQQIKEGVVDPEKLPKEIRQACVECLLTQFMPVSKIAAVMKVDDRTIQRDKKGNRSKKFSKAIRGLFPAADI